MCGRHAIAEDVVQEAFLSLWRNAARYDRGRESVRSWILSLVHHRASDAFRRDAVRTRRNVADDAAAMQIPAPARTETEVGRRDEARQILVALGVLPTEQRQVIELAYFGGFSHRQIAAEMLTLPAGTVKAACGLA